MKGCKSDRCNQGRKLCPHPFLCQSKASGGGGSGDTPATPRVWLWGALCALLGWVALLGLASMLSGCAMPERWQGASGWEIFIDVYVLIVVGLYVVAIVLGSRNSIRGRQ